ncbi:CHAT domain-containing protein [Synechococcus lacustris]|uniref:CHAT domain-containing protein n=1 Tax=Synechococcus lacustris TaxID=2116544 RepID=UPI0020CC302E|nr:CHAT domain-containing protein [Synechococcus lacustris]MCP9794936.1 CHAT domain-containing protein [Synechococcus lacustris L1F-Slac]
MALAKNRNFTVGLFAVLGLSFGLSTNATAQVLGSSGARNLSTQVGGTSSEAVITGGTQRGNKLFHSFSRFDIAPGSSAVFDGSGTSGVQTIFGRIETGPSKLAGPLGGRNWGGASPELMLMNPFGFIVEKGFSISGLTPLSLFAVDALMFRDPSSQALFPFDMNISASGLQVTTPNWDTAEFVGFLMDSSYPNGRGGGPISVQGGFGLPHLNLAGSKINIEGDALQVDNLNIYAQAFNGAYVNGPSGDWNVGSFNPNGGVFTPYTSASQVGGVAPESGLVDEMLNPIAPQAGYIQYEHYNDLTGMRYVKSLRVGVPCGSNCPAGTIQISANIEPYQSSTASLNLISRQLVLGPFYDQNNITSHIDFKSTSYLSDGLYHLFYLLPKKVTERDTTYEDNYAESVSKRLTAKALSAGESITEELLAEILRNIYEDVQSFGAESFREKSFGAERFSAKSEMPNAAPGIPALDSSGQIASIQLAPLLMQFEQRNSEKVAVALGLSLQEAAKSLSTVDIQNGLKTAITSVRTAAGKQAGLGLDPGLGLLASAATNNQALLNPAFNRAAYNPAVLHLRYSTAAVGGFDGQLDLVLITATGEPKGIRVPLRQADFRDSLQKLYGALSRQENLSVNDPNGPSRSLYRQIFASLEPILQEQKITTLLLSADQGLQAIPYAALHNGKQFLGEQYGLSLTPSLNLTNLQAPLGRGGDLLALGASNFDGLAPLPLVPEELRAVSIGQKSEIFLNQAFTPSALLISAADPRFRRVHVATHAEFLPGGPSQSRIYTGTGAVALKEFANLRSRRADASLDLISLSACRTAIGDPDSELGFAGLALQAGARSAIGSLWYVDDVATSAFFVQTYRYLEAGVPKAEALQLTRQAFSRGLIRLDADRVVGASGEVLLAGLDASQRRIAASGLTHPYFWGGIQLMGSPW